MVKSTQPDNYWASLASGGRDENPPSTRHCHQIPDKQQGGRDSFDSEFEGTVYCGGGGMETGDKATVRKHRVMGAGVQLTFF